MAVTVQRVGTMLTPFFTRPPVRDYARRAAHRPRGVQRVLPRHARRRRVPPPVRFRGGVHLRGARRGRARSVRGRAGLRMAAVAIVGAGHRGADRGLPAQAAGLSGRGVRGAGARGRRRSAPSGARAISPSWGRTRLAAPAPPLTRAAHRAGARGLAGRGPRRRPQEAIHRAKGQAGRACRCRPHELLTTRLLSNGAKLAVFGEPLVDAGDSPVEESVATFVRRRFNQEVLDYVANPFVAGIFAGDPEQLSVRHALPRLHGLERTHGSVMKAFGGMMLRAERSRRRPGADPRLISFARRAAGAARRARRASCTPRSALQGARDPAPPRPQGVDGRRGVPGGGAVRRGGLRRAGALSRRDRPRPSRAATGVKTLASIGHPPVGVLALGFRREDVAHPLDGFGFLVPEVERRHVLGVIFSSTRLSRPRARRARAAHRVRRRSAQSGPGQRRPQHAHGPGARRPAAAAGRPGRAHLPRVPSLAQGDPAVRAELRPIQGDHGRGRAAESRLRAGRLLSRGRGRGRRDHVGDTGGRSHRRAARRQAKGTPASERPAGAPSRHAGQRARALADGARAAVAARTRVMPPSGSRSAPPATWCRTCRSRGSDRAALFTRQIDDAMLDGRIDLAVHSLKDLPTDAARGHRGRGGRRARGSERRARGPRADPSGARCRGVLWSPPAAFAGGPSSSMRGPTSGSATSAVTWTPDSAKLDSAEGWSAILLAAAGLVRLGLGDRIGERLPSEVMLPAPGQGALAVTARADDLHAIGAARAAVHHRPSALAVSAERAFLRRMEGGCQVPVAALAVLADDTLRLHGRVIALDGSRLAEGRESARIHEVPDAEQLGTALAERLIREGAAEILAEVRAAHAPVRHRAVSAGAVVVTAAAGSFPGLVEALRSLSAEVIEIPAAHLRGARRLGRGGPRASASCGGTRRSRSRRPAPRPHSADAGSRSAATRCRRSGPRVVARRQRYDHSRAPCARLPRTRSGGWAPRRPWPRRCCERE